MYVLGSIVLGLVLTVYGIMVFRAVSDYSKGITSVKPVKSYKQVEDIRDKIRDKYYL